MVYLYASEDPVAIVAELISLTLIIASFLVVTYLTLRSRSRKSFQFEMFLFTVVLVVAEIPRTLYSLGIIDLDWLSAFGLEIHSVSMVTLTAFVAIRFNGFFRKGEALGKDFEGVAASSIGTSIENAVGEDAMKSLDFYIHTGIAVSDPQGYARALQKIFGSGSKVLVDAVVRGVCGATGVEPVPDMTLAAAVDAGRQKFLASGTPLRG
jgi:hypothetical protein